MRRFLLCGCLSCLTVTGCSSNGSPSANRVGPAGGVVSSSDGKLRIVQHTPTQTHIDCAKAATNCPTSSTCWQGLI